jgi:hypothetical protein
MNWIFSSAMAAMTKIATIAMSKLTPRLAMAAFFHHGMEADESKERSCAEAPLREPRAALRSDLPRQKVL